MLVLMRRCQESVVVGASDDFRRNLKVTVLEIKGKKVKLGFDVDPGVPVHRMEVWARINSEALETGNTRCPDQLRTSDDAQIVRGRTKGDVGSASE